MRYGVELHIKVKLGCRSALCSMSQLVLVLSLATSLTLAFFKKNAHCYVVKFLVTKLVD